MVSVTYAWVATLSATRPIVINLIELVRREGLAHQQRTAALHGEIDRGEGAGLAARLDEGRAAAVDDVNGPIAHSAAGRCDA